MQLALLAPKGHPERGSKPPASEIEEESRGPSNGRGPIDWPMLDAGFVRWPDSMTTRSQAEGARAEESGVETSHQRKRQEEPDGNAAYGISIKTGGRLASSWSSIVIYHGPKPRLIGGESKNCPVLNSCLVWCLSVCLTSYAHAHALSRPLPIPQMVLAAEWRPVLNFQCIMVVVSFVIFSGYLFIYNPLYLLPVAPRRRGPNKTKPPSSIHSSLSTQPCMRRGGGRGAQLHSFSISISSFPGSKYRTPLSPLYSSLSPPHIVHCMTAIFLT